MRDPHRATHDLIEIDERLSPEQLVDFVFARGVNRHQPLQRRRLVVRVVIDVQIRPAAEPIPDEIDELLERPLLACAIGRAKRMEALLSIVDGDGAEQVFEAAVGSKNGKPSMSKNMSPSDGGGRGGIRSRRRRQQLVAMRARRAEMGLKRRLPPETSKCDRADAVDAAGTCGEIGGCANAGSVHPAHLAAANRRHQAQVIGLVPMIGAVTLVAAE